MFLKIFKYGGTNGVAFIADTALLITLDYLLNVRREYIAFVLLMWFVGKLCFGKKIRF